MAEPLSPMMGPRSLSGRYQSMQGWFWWVHTGGGAGRAHGAVVAGQRRLMIRRLETQKTTWVMGCEPLLPGDVDSPERKICPTSGAVNL